MGEYRMFAWCENISENIKVTIKSLISPFILGVSLFATCQTSIQLMKAPICTRVTSKTNEYYVGIGGVKISVQ